MTTQRTALSELDTFLDTINSPEPTVLRDLREETLGDPLSHMAISPITARCLAAFVTMIDARKICEVGVYTGYSSLSMAMAMADDARLWCFDVNPAWTAIAQRYWRRACVDHKVTLTLGDAAASMRRLVDDGHEGSFDLVFIDADKSSYGRYWDLAHVLLRRRGAIVVDNTLFQQAVAPEWTDDRLAEKWADLDARTRAVWIRNTHHIRTFNRKVQEDGRFQTVTLPLGDGLTLAVKR